MKEKVGSLIIAIFCLVCACLIEGPSGLAMGIAVVPLLACIWFKELLGSITGFGGFRHPVVNKQTPGCFVGGMGWLGLLALTGALTKHLIQV